MKENYITLSWLLRAAVIIAVATISICPAVSAQMSNDEMLLAYTRANEYFSQANRVSQQTQEAKELYRLAILNYEKIIEQGGIHNAKLYYNLANSYLLAGDIGEAILNYRRAQRLDGSNPDIHKNLSFARSRRVDKLTATTSKKVLERLFFWHWDFSVRTRFLTGGICFALLCLWLTGRVWFVKWQGTGPVCTVLFIIFAAMAGSVVVDQYAESNNLSGVITADSVIARQGDGQNYPQSFNEPLHEGVEFEVIEQRPGWLHVKLANGENTWVPQEAAKLI